MKSIAEINTILSIFTLVTVFVVMPSHAMLMASKDAGGESPVTSSDFILGPTTPGKWGPPVFGTGATITWSLMPTGTSCDAIEFSGCTISALYTFMPEGFLVAINAAFSAWSAVADITFVQESDSGAAVDAPAATADLRLGGHVFDGVSGTIAHGFFPPENGTSIAGDIHFDSEELWKIGFGGEGFDVFQVTAHEIGHAIGLDHTVDPLSLMSPVYTEAFDGPQAGDIAGAVFLYGAPATMLPIPTTTLLMATGLLGLGIVRHGEVTKRKSSTG